MINPFNEAKSLLNIREVAADFGVTINNYGFALCPFHPEKSASLKIYDDSFHCFGCGAHGDIITFAQLLHGLSEPMGGLKLLNEKYNLNLLSNKPLTAEERRRAQEAARQRENDNNRLAAFDEWEWWACRTIAAYIRTMEAWKINYAPTSPEDEISPLWLEALHNITTWNYFYFSIFVEDDFRAKISFFKEHREEVELIAERIDANRENRIA